MPTNSKEKITQVAFHLFSIKGYEKTTYKDIAEAANIKRNLVQYHFPQKELFITAFLNKLATVTEEYVEIFYFKSKNDFTALHHIGQIYFSFLLKDEGMRAFTCDIISNRKHTVNSLVFNEGWVLSFHKMEQIEQQLEKEIADNFILTMGGAYELLYKYMINDEEIPLIYLLDKIIVNFTSALGYDSDDTTRLLSQSILDCEEIEKAIFYISRILFKK